MSITHRSQCPVNLALEVIGDRWTLLVLRDIMFREHANFRALLEGSDEGISPSVLADRLARLMEAGVLRRQECSTHRQKSFYRLTEAGADLVPVIAAIGTWGARHRGADPGLCPEALSLGQGGEAACGAFKEQLLQQGPAT
jgi:DNA-binding HxlR family transcriptional regulator